MPTVTAIIHTGLGDSFYAYIPELGYGYQINSTDYYPVGPTYGGVPSSVSGGFVFQGNLGTGDALYFSDGSVTTVIPSAEDGTVFGTPRSFYQFAGESVFLDYYEDPLYITNGSAAPSVLISTDVVDYTRVGNSLYVWTQGDLVRVNQDRSKEVVYDNDASGPYSGLHFSYIFEMNGDLWARASTGFAHDYYRYDPGSGSFSNMNIGVNSGGDSLYFRYGDVGDSQFFSWLFTSANGRELYVSDGTTGSFSLVKDINPGSNSSYLGNSPSATLGNTLVFVADDGGAGDEELWVSDGTSAGTFALTGTGTPFGAWNSYSSQFVSTGGRVFFSGYRNGEPDLYVTDGTVAGTQMVIDLPLPSSSYSIKFLGSWNDGLLFTSNGLDGSALWYSDGTAAGTYILQNPSPESNQFNNEIDFVGLAELDIDKLGPLPINGTADADSLAGTALRDIIFGLAGNDTLDGGAGVDALDGGTGDDTYIVDNVGDTVTEAFGAGTDTVRSSVDFTLGSNVENLTFTGTGNFSGTGNDLDNILIGGAGFDTLVGGAGNDRLDGGTNSATQGDILLGGLGNDTYLVDSALDLVDEGIVFGGAAGGTDEIISTADFFWDFYSAGDILRIAEGANDPGNDGTTGVGSVFSNTLIGNSGTNVLFGRGGADTYRAGDGIDFMSLSLLGLTEANAYAGVDGVNTVIVEQRTTGLNSYDIIFEFEAGKDKVNVADYASVNGLSSGADVVARAIDDGIGNSYIALGDGFDYVYMVGLEKADLQAGDFIVA